MIKGVRLEKNLVYRSKYKRRGIKKIFPEPQSSNLVKGPSLFIHQRNKKKNLFPTKK
jgi:hypothetical protein